MKKYENPMLQVVSIKKNDIIATSGEETATVGDNVTRESGILAPGQRGINSWYEGY